MRQADIIALVGALLVLLPVANARAECSCQQQSPTVASPLQPMAAQPAPVLPATQRGGTAYFLSDTTTADIAYSSSRPLPPIHTRARGTYSDTNFARSGYGYQMSQGCTLCSFANHDCGCSSGRVLGGCRDCGCRERCCCPCELGEPKRIIGEMCCGLNIYGWLNGGYMASEAYPASNWLSPLGFSDRDTGQGNQIYIVAEEALTGCGLEIGGRVDVYWGTDARFTEVPGLELHRDGTDKWSTEPFYRTSAPQFYAELGYNGFSLLAGHFYTTIGYEVVTAPDNFFYSHAYTMLYGEPFTHTGALAKWAGDSLELYGGVHNGWDNFNSLHQRASFLGGANWSGENLWVAASVTYGDELNPSDFFTNRTLYSVVVGLNLGCNMQYVVQHDYGWQKDVVGDEQAEWYGLNQYVYYSYTERLKFGVRAEWFRDDDGFRVENQFGGGFEGNFYEVTLGANWQPCCNFMVRPEVRYDWYDGVGQPYNDGTETNQLTFGLDAILHF